MKIWFITLGYWCLYFSSSCSFTFHQKVLLMKDIERLNNERPIDFIAEAIRLGFHDAGTYESPSIGGPDGCVLEDDSPNRALIPVIQTLDNLRNAKYCNISRADFWLFTATYATDLAASFSSDSKDLQLINQFRWGRKDRTDCASDKGKLPDVGFTVEEVVATFHKRLQLTIEEMVAISGGHSVGRVLINRKENTYKAFDSTPSRFDNVLYKEILNFEWTRNRQFRIPVWNSNYNTLLFHTDLLMAYDIGNFKDTCEINIGPHSCSVNANDYNTRQWVETFAQNQPQFYRSYAKAWKRLIELGYEDHQLHVIHNVC